MKRYEEYKDSGLPWAPRIPLQWQEVPLKQAYKFQTGATPPTKINRYFEGENIWANISDLNGKVITDSYKHISDEALKVCSMNVSPKGSLMFSFKLSVGTVAFCGCDMYTNEAIATFLRGKNDLNYLYYAGPFFIIKNANENIYGAKLLNQDLINNAKIFLPPLSEQKSIASFLDAKTKPIEDIIAKREKQILLLEEMKAAIISRAVTKGLNPNAKMKDSGIEWIGEVPEQWGLRRLKFIVKNEKYNIKTGPFGTQLKGDDLKEQGDVPVYNQRNIIDNQFDNPRLFVTQRKAEELSSFHTKPNDILITSRGTIGRAAILPKEASEGILHPCLIALRINRRLAILEYLLYYINGFNGFSINVFLESNATTIEVIYTETLKNIYITLPPLSEQLSIVSYLDTETAKIDARIAKRRKQIALLQEYRQALITDAVTGKIDVRDN